MKGKTPGSCKQRGQAGKMDIYDEIFDALKERSEWEQRQAVWYKLRHQGLRRKSKPYPNAPDFHVPLADSMIEKHKPFFVQQLYASGTFASFVSLKPQDGELTSAAEGWFDYKQKQETNIERELMCAFDHMEMNGSCPVKIYWDADKKRVCYEAIDPLYLIVPTGCSELEDADWLVHVIHMTERQYRKNPKFKQDDAFVKSIKGKNSSITGAANKEQEVSRREGITCGQTEEQIVLWEIECRKDGKIIVETVSPMLPKDENKVRDDFELPYNKGVFKDGDRFNYGRFRMEIKDKGWYSPRGLPEIVAPFEASLCKMQNAKHQFMDFSGQPMFNSAQDIPNASNIKMLPGQILPPGLTPVEFPQPPISFDEEMQATRSWVEYRVNIPDLGASQHLSGPSGYNGQKPTAAQINAIVGQSGVSDDMRARIVRLDLADLYQMAWALRLQYDKASLDYVVSGELLKLDATALHESYQISPSGSADSWNKGLQAQKAVARFTMLKGDPYINQGELRKDLLESDDPARVKRLYQDPGEELQSQMEVQAQEISIMVLGFPAEVRDEDDDKAHLQSMLGFGQRRIQTGEPISPELARLLLMHGQGHLAALQKKKDPALKQLQQQLQPFIQGLLQLAQQPDQQPSNVIQGPGAQQPQGQTEQLNAADAAKLQLDAQKTAAAVANSLAGLIKSGVTITDAEINKVLQQMGLPPLAVQPSTQSVSQPPIQQQPVAANQ